jgi:hypothetical protein
MTITLREQQPMVKYRHTHFGDSRATATMSPWKCVGEELRKS